MKPSSLLCLGFFLVSSVFQVSGGDAVAVSPDPIEEILRPAGQGAVVIDYSFSCKAPGGRSAAGSGTLSSQNGMYRLENGPFTVYDNGKERLTLNRNTREAVRQKSSFTNEGTADLYSFLRLLGFNPKGALVSTVSDSGGNVRGLKAELKDGTKISVTVKSVKYSPALSRSDFSLDTSTLGKLWTVTDLR